MIELINEINLIFVFLRKTPKMIYCKAKNKLLLSLKIRTHTIQCGRLSFAGVRLHFIIKNLEQEKKWVTYGSSPEVSNLILLFKHVIHVCCEDLKKWEPFDRMKKVKY